MTMSKSSGLVTTVLVAVVAAAVAGGGGYMVGARAQQPENVAVATVNGQPISKTSFYDKLVKQSGKDVIGRMIDEEVVNQGLKAAGVTVTDAEINAEITKLKEHLGGEEKFNAALAQYNVSVDQLKEDQAFRLKMTKLLSKDLKVNDADVKKFFDENRAQFDKREVQSRHILLKTEEEAKAVKAELDKGADFAKLAQEKSTDPSAKQNSGDLGFNKPGAMVPEYDAVVFKLKKGEISAPFKSQFGWHVAQVTDIKGEEPVFDKIKDQVKDSMLQSQIQEKIQPWLDEQKAKAKITNTLDTAPKK